jgi:hypothetical protein
MVYLLIAMVYLLIAMVYMYHSHGVLTHWHPTAPCARACVRVAMCGLGRRLVELGGPDELRARPGGAFAKLLHAQELR